MKNNLDDFAIVTFPRVGSHYLQNILFYKTGFIIPRSHKYQDKKMITIIRDPFDTLVSAITMRKHYQLSARFEDWIDEYRYFYTYMLDKEIIRIKYDDLINRPLWIADEIINRMGITKNENLIPTTIEEVKDKPDGDHLVTSTSSNLYETTKQELSNYDLSDLYILYNLNLKKTL